MIVNSRRECSRRLECMISINSYVGGKPKNNLDYFKKINHHSFYMMLIVGAGSIGL